MLNSLDIVIASRSHLFLFRYLSKVIVFTVRDLRKATLRHSELIASSTTSAMRWVSGSTNRGRYTKRMLARSHARVHMSDRRTVSRTHEKTDGTPASNRTHTIEQDTPRQSAPSSVRLKGRTRVAPLAMRSDWVRRGEDPHHIHAARRSTKSSSS